MITQDCPLHDSSSQPASLRLQLTSGGAGWRLEERGSVFDQDSFEVLAMLLGRATAMTRLANFAQGLAVAFPDGGEERAASQVFFEAHRIVAHAGILGFPSLADASIDLQVACRSSRGIAPAYLRARKAAADVLESIQNILG